ncbi:MAG: cytochrome b/b6 domain-containing protein [Bacteroidales bacterium]|nr:cytochrome b/b6 domain-containing protein [Bacteroidales bacterium]
MNDKVYLYPVWIRMWHWTNACLCLLLIITGISMQYSDPSYPMMRFDWAVSIHDIAGILLAVSYLGFVIGNLFTTNGKHYRFRKGIIKNLFIQARYYAFGIFKNEKPPFPISKESKFNPLQKFSYIAVMHLIVPVVIISGIFLFFPVLLNLEIFGNKALHTTDIIHVIMGFFVSLFLLVHLYFCTIGCTPVSNFKSMFTGYHERH